MSATGKMRVVVVGGGLAGSLLGYRLIARHPELELTVIEAGSVLGGDAGDRVWSFHESDLRQAARGGLLIDPGFVRGLASARWPDHGVRFDGFARTLSGAYYSVRSRDLHFRLAPMLGSRLRLGARAVTLEPTGVVLEGGERLAADLVVDARGGGRFRGGCAWQTFFGLYLRTAAPHGQTRPMLMDAEVPQRGGYRFIYLLPFGEHELLVEDTRYSASAAVDEAGARAFLPEYVRGLGIRSWTETGAERGALPIPLLSAEAPVLAPGIVPLGVGAGHFHPTTGYSLREAALGAELLARTLATRPPAALAAQFHDYAAARWRAGHFYRRLNNMLFLAAAPDERWRVMARFYRLDEPVISRFYSGTLTAVDRLKILVGRPPVPVARGLKAYFYPGAAHV